jgi:taspase (threonine aspartase 1)
VGAIAIDSFGRIAAASSSGGIGMKHKGRTGPAALVGIGTAVHPVHEGDKESKTTATVTSGTGEHMATTLAAGTCADRLYYGQKLAADGSFSDADDEEALASFVKDGFMGMDCHLI